MLDLYQIRTRWSFLQTLHPLFLFAESLPTVEVAGSFQYVNNSLDNIERVKNEITMLRNDFKLNIIKQEQIDIDELTDDQSLLQELQTVLHTLLVELENLIDAQVEAGNEYEGLSSMLSLFPRLVALRGLLQSQDDTELLNVAIIGEDDAVSHATFDGSVSTGTGSHWSRRFSQTSVSRAASYIRFPRDSQKLESCRRVVSHFGSALDRHLGESNLPWSSAEYTPQDIATIQNAHAFSTSCTSLFSQMVGGTTCSTPHRAKVHLSGFSGDQMRMNIRTCQEQEPFSVLVATKSSQSTAQPVPFDHLCAAVPSLYPASDEETLRIAFDTLGTWIEPEESSTFDEPIFQFPCDQYVSLDSLIDNRNLLNAKFRKLVGVLLAASLFRLGDSPWIEQQLEGDKIFVPPRDNKRLREWCPRVNCTLESTTTNVPRSEQIAALGVLILELEAHCKAQWTEWDSDWETGEKSNYVRLARIVNEWEDSVSDEYRGIAKACLEFNSLIAEVDHQDINPDSKGLAVIFKNILEPLWRYMITSFGRLDSVFRGLFASEQSNPSFRRLSARTTAKRALFDDGDSSRNTEQQSSGDSFMSDLKPFFDRIEALKSQGENIRLTNRPERVRIAVLDSGVDDTDSMIRFAIRKGRINGSKSKSFVSQRLEDWRSDSHGHGTHVTRLLLRTAPAAEIFVCKVCTEKMINDEFMPGIAKAITWAVEECDVDIISMSFGFEEEDALIDTAIDEAVDAGKLIFAAASNNGGLSGRARPARYEGVICMHASDGKGNKGNMNPTPLLKRDNFSTLGVAVPSKWKDKDVWKSGTSFATPIAAGFAADVLEFANYKCMNLMPRKRKILGKKRGMQAIFQTMAEERDSYDFIHPVRLWKDWGESGDGKMEQEAATTIEQILQDI